MLAEDTDTFWTFLRSIPWWAWIPIVAIVGGILQGTVKMSHRHRERMEMIRQGINPDAPQK